MSSKFGRQRRRNRTYIKPEIDDEKGFALYQKWTANTNTTTSSSNNVTHYQLRKTLSTPVVKREDHPPPLEAVPPPPLQKQPLVKLESLPAAAPPPPPPPPLPKIGNTQWMVHMCPTLPMSTHSFVTSKFDLRRMMYLHNGNDFNDCRELVTIMLCVQVRMQLYEIFSNNEHHADIHHHVRARLSPPVRDILLLVDNECILRDMLSFWSVYYLLNLCTSDEQKCATYYNHWVCMEERILSYRLSVTDDKWRILRHIIKSGQSPIRGLSITTMSELHQADSYEGLYHDSVRMYGPGNHTAIMVDDVFDMISASKKPSQLHNLRRYWNLSEGRAVACDTSMVHAVIKLQSVGLYQHLANHAVRSNRTMIRPEGGLKSLSLIEALREIAQGFMQGVIHVGKPMYTFTAKGANSQIVWYAAPRCVKELCNNGVHIHSDARAFIAGWHVAFGMDIKPMIPMIERTMTYYWTHVKKMPLNEIKSELKSAISQIKATKKPYSYSCGTMDKLHLCPEYIGGGGCSGYQRRCQLNAIKDIEDISPVTARGHRPLKPNLHIYTPLGVTQMVLDALEERGVDLTHPLSQRHNPFTLSKRTSIVKK